MIRKKLFILTLATFLSLTIFSFTAHSAGDAAKGKEKFDTICATCHGPAGKGDGVAAAALDPKPRNLSDSAYVSALTDDYMKKVIGGGGASVGKSALMPAWEGVLTPEDITNVIAYIRKDICKCKAK
ncbi:MAG: c-type cytochrome [Thermodesulfobacteriota bacterium]